MAQAGRALWVPSTQMGLVQGMQTMVVKGEGAYILTEEGSRLYDASATLWYANIGHGDARVVEAAADQMRELETFQTWGGFLNPRAAELADRLSERHAPFPDSKVLFGAGGSDAAELAFKLARLHWQRKGAHEKRTILSRENAYHGLHAFGTSLYGNNDMRSLYGGGNLIPDTGLISRDDIEAVRRQVLEIGPERIAAIAAEPVIGSGGVHPPADGYLEGLRALCDEFDMLLIFDEVISGFGRTGEWFASDHFGVQPDMTMFAKGITCGYFPLGGLFVSRKIWEPFWSEDPEFIYHFGVTYSGHATGCAVALKVLDILEEDRLLPRVKHLGTRLANGLREQVAAAPGVKTARSVGLIGIVELSDGIDARAVSLVMRSSHGVLARPLGTTAIALAPPFISTEAEIENLIDALSTAPASAPASS
ncbi:aspartate aminotransferase family protein [Leucobacter sp. wl10]|uniref:aminotransferase family protein n=1 Tax=Leucobacter sp. wl10 TaxID=2304677 RepID=UPI0013C34939|nr:aminotransferase class III-fold pyridoxal phosphate-dependent enzyme [Leucobacter sp. wl10]